MEDNEPKAQLHPYTKSFEIGERGRGPPRGRPYYDQCCQKLGYKSDQTFANSSPKSSRP